MLYHPGDRFGLEKVGGVLQITDELIIGFSEIQGEIEHCGAGINLRRGNAKIARARHSDADVLQNEHHLKKGMIAPVTNWMEFLNKLFEGKILMRAGIER